MFNDIFISVIVPCYNVEKYIERCVESIINQKFSNYEIILIDDGSTDATTEIISILSEQYSKIVPIYKKNGGMGDARNVGIDTSKGNYLTFIDSDDYISDDYLSNLVKGIHSGADLSISHMIKVNDNEIKKTGNNKCSKLISIYEIEEVMKLLLSQKLENAAWGKLYPRRCFNKLRFPRDKYYEDLGVVYEYIGEVSKIAVINSQDYYYVQRNNSIMSQDFNLKKMDILEMGKKAEIYLKKNFKNLSPYIHSRLFAAYSGVFLEVPIGDKQFQSEENTLWKELCEERKVVLYSPKNLKVWFGAMVSLFGKDIFKRIGQKMKR